MEVLYRKYRPKNLKEVLGQPKVTSHLENVLGSGKNSHAYLFTGPRGTGKTSVARIIAKILNCEGKKERPCEVCISCQAVSLGNHLDVVEIDAASNRGIDDIRSLRETVGLLPQMGKYKVYILDEVHMLTAEAFNALLKTLEEPPPHVVFILCTTESYKIPETVLSRVLRFDFEIPSVDILAKQLKKIAQAEEVKINDEALNLLAQRGDGSFRDAEVLFEKVMGSTEASRTINLEAVREALGLVDSEVVDKFLDFLVLKDGFGAIKFLSDLADSLDLSEFVKAVLLELRDNLLGISKKKRFESEELIRLTGLLLNAQKEIKYSDLPQLPLELALLDYCQRINLSNPKEVKVLLDPPAAHPSNNKIVDDPINDDSKKENFVKKEFDLDKLWPRLLESVRPYNHTLEAFLKACRPVSLEGNILDLKFDFPFHRDQVNKEQNRRLAEEAFSKVFGFNIKVRTSLGTRKKDTNFQDRLEVEAPKKEEKAAEGNKNSKNNEAGDLLEKAARALGGKVIK